MSMGPVHYILGSMQVYFHIVRKYSMQIFFRYFPLSNINIFYNVNADKNLFHKIRTQKYNSKQLQKNSSVYRRPVSVASVQKGSDRGKVRRKAGLKHSRNNNHLENTGTLSTRGKSELAQKTGNTQNIYTKEVGIIRHR